MTNTKTFWREILYGSGLLLVLFQGPPKMDLAIWLLFIPGSALIYSPPILDLTIMGGFYHKVKLERIYFKKVLDSWLSLMAQSSLELEKTKFNNNKIKK